MKNALVKDTLREIKRTFSRFISIFAIVALGVSFFAGVKAAGPDMKITADKYFDDYNLMDLRVLSTIGFNDDDVEAIKEISEVEEVWATYSMDAVININDKDMVIKVHGLPADKINTSDKSYINRTKLVEGRYPQKQNECLAEKGKIINSGLSIGSKIKLSSGTDKDINESLKTNEFTIVGIVETPYYISFERGSSSIGSGKISTFIMILEENFKIPAYTDIFVTVKGAKSAMAYDEKYNSIIEPVKKALESTGEYRGQIRYDEIISEANEQLSSMKNQYKEAEEKQKKELEDAAAKLDESRKQIQDGMKQLQDKKNKFNNLVKKTEAQINEGYKKLEDSEKQYNQNLQEFLNSKARADVEFPLAEQQINSLKQQLDDIESQLNDLKSAISSHSYSSSEQKTQMEHQAAALEEQLTIGKAKLETAKSKLYAKKNALLDASAQLEQARNSIDASRHELEKQAEEFERTKKKAQGEFASAKKKLDEAQKQLKQGEDDYLKAKQESDDMLSNAWQRIVDAEEEIKNIEKPSWYVLDRNTNPGFAGYGAAADRMDAIAAVFPVFFFLIASLVCLTAMTRMVDEQRSYIGILKALGYSKANIALKYLMYAALSSIGGSIFGLATGFKLFPTVIFNAYGIMYTLPPVITKFHIGYAVISMSCAVLATVLAAWFACSSELLAYPASLMRPKAPKPGKRVLIEKINFIWSRLDFTQKITARNLFRYKKRFFMTILGIGGCTALLLAGFGLRDSILSIVSKQFDELYQYNMLITIKENRNEEENKKLISTIEDDSRITDYLLIREQNIDVGYGNTEKNATLLVPEMPDRLNDFIIFRDRTTGQKVSFPDDGIVITEKLANMLGVTAGDEIYIKDGETRRVNVKISGITENYVYHYIYMPPSLYESVYGKEANFQEIIAKTTDVSQDFEDQLSTDLLEDTDISSVTFTTGISSNFEDIISSLNYVVLVLIVSAAALAFIVLYNLTDINMTERIREIATIKVLGFYDTEVTAYIYRENIILTLLGMGLGLIFGIFLHKYIVINAEVDYVMFGRDIKRISFLYSAILTIIFSGLVNLVMHFKLKKISMVESLKSVE